jgi:hypothetical protein
MRAAKNKAKMLDKKLRVPYIFGSPGCIVNTGVLTSRTAGSAVIKGPLKSSRGVIPRRAVAVEAKIFRTFDPGNP